MSGPDDKDAEVELRVCRKCSHQIEALVQMCPSGGLCSSDESIAPPDDEDAIIGQQSTLPMVDAISLADEVIDLRTKLAVHAETIRQLTELLREYRERHRTGPMPRCINSSISVFGGDYRCPLCIKADQAAQGEIKKMEPELFWEDPAFPLPFVKAGLESHMNTYVRSEDYYAQEETIRQLTELVREYEAGCTDCWSEEFPDSLCPRCIKADLLLKEPAVGEGTR